MIDWLVERPEFFVAFFVTLGGLAAYALWCATGTTLRKIEEAEAEMEHVTKVGNLYVVHPDRESYGGGDAA